MSRLPRVATLGGARERGAGRRAGAPRGVLAVLALLLASSAVTRLGFGTGLEPVRAAMAEGVVASGQALAAAPAALAEIAGAGEADGAFEPERVAARPSGEDAQGIEALIEALAEREAALDEREAALAERAAAEERRLAEGQGEMAETRAELQGMLDELEAAEARLDAAIARASGAAEDDLARLTSVYESMKPKDAAALFETMESGFAAGFLGRMRPEAAAEVMAGMSPDRAYAVSAIIAGRNARLDDGPAGEAQGGPADGPAEGGR